MSHNDAHHDAHDAFDHERTDVAPRWPILIGIGMLLTLPITIAIVSALMSTIWAPPRHAAQGPQLAAPAPNAPRLQTHPKADFVALQDKWDKRLHGIGWADRDAGIVHVPIDQAEKRLLENGLPQDTRIPPPSRVGGEPGAPPGQNNHNDRKEDRAAVPEPERSPPTSNEVKPEANSGTDHAGNGMVRPARNNAKRAPAVPYREDRMQR